jgi:hypothetical protein
MEAADYRLAWIVYVAAGIVVAFMCWRVLQQYLLRELAYFLECILLALMFTPAYVMVDQPIMAPALMVFVMDAITIEPKAGIRALIPLVLALIAAFVIAIALSLVHRWRQRRQVVQPGQ